MKQNQVYGSFDLGFGAHVALDPEHYEALIPNVFVTQTSLGKLIPKSGCSNWDLKWEYCKKMTQTIARHLSEGKMTEEFARKELVKLQKEIDSGIINL